MLYDMNFARNSNLFRRMAYTNRIARLVIISSRLMQYLVIQRVLYIYIYTKRKVRTSKVILSLFHILTILETIELNVESITHLIFMINYIIFLFTYSR